MLSCSGGFFYCWYDVTKASEAQVLLNPTVTVHQEIANIHWHNFLISFLPLRREGSWNKAG